jgi:hypothetical protein
MATAKLFASMPLNGFGSNASGGASMDLLSDVIMAQLHLAAYTPNQTTQTVKADLTNEVANGSGYTTGGVALGTKTWTVSSLVSTFDAADASWTTLTKTHRYLVLLDDTVATPADPLIGWVDSGGDQQNTATDLTYVWNASGIFSFTVA